VAVAEDQREQVPLFISQRRKRVHHLLDVSVQIVFVVSSRRAAPLARRLRARAGAREDSA
jgi:hypothetical protein